MKVAVVGCGYVGLVTAVGMATAGHDVVGVEVEDTRLAGLSAGTPPFFEPGLAERLDEALKNGRLRFTGSIDEVAGADVVFLAVQTPAGPDGASDLSFLRAAATSVAATLGRTPSHRCAVVVRSTVVPGTTDEVVTPLFADVEGNAVGTAANPEFLREGSAVADFLEPDRVVVGSHDRWVLDRMEQLYAPFEAPFVATTPATAELVKYASNSLLATLISFSNEIARISERLPGVDVEEVMDALHLDRRLSPRVADDMIRPGILSYLRAGCGYGGSCLPKDLSALIAAHSTADAPLVLLEAVREVNRTQPRRVVDLAERALGGLAGRKVGVLGVAFKAGTDDLRSSPGLLIVDDLLERDADVAVHDPLVGAERLAAYVARGVQVIEHRDELLAQVDACIITTREDDFATLGAEIPDDGPVLIDGRRIVPPGDLAPDRYLAVGRGH